MNRLKLLFISLFILTANCCRVTEKEITADNNIKSIDEKYKINKSFDFNGKVATWFNFREAACSITFDDGTLDQYVLAYPELEKAGIKGTFFLAASLIENKIWDDNGTKREMMNWSQAAEIAASGHEIGSHSFNHIDMSVNNSNYYTELEYSQSFIENRIPEIKVETFCWPHWRESEEAIISASDYYISARSGNGIISYYLKRKGGLPGETPENMFRVNALGLMNSQSGEEWQEIIDLVYKNKGWYIPSYHGINDDIISEESLGWSPLYIDNFIKSINYPKEAGFWIETFGNVSKYIYERDKAVLHIKNKGSSLEISLEDELDDKIYNQPLSISISRPENWKEIIILNKNNEKVPFYTINNVLYINILPDGSPLVIKPLLTIEK